jgi:hypothetical protein
LYNSCNRRNCTYGTNRIVFNHRICEDCASEFRSLVGDKKRTEREFRQLFVDFIMSDKTLGSNTIITVDEFMKIKYEDDD